LAAGDESVNSAASEPLLPHDETIDIEHTEYIIRTGQSHTCSRWSVTETFTHIDTWSHDVFFSRIRQC